MPIKKIILSEEIVKKIEAGQAAKSSPVFIAVPVGTAPENAGEHVLQEIQQKYHLFTASASTGNTISFVAQQGAKDGWSLTGVKVSIFPPNIEFEWSKENQGR